MAPATEDEDVVRVAMSNDEEWLIVAGVDGSESLSVHLFY